MITYYVPEELSHEFMSQFYNDNSYNENELPKFILDISGGIETNWDYDGSSIPRYIKFKNQSHLTMFLLKLQ